MRIAVLASGRGSNLRALIHSRDARRVEFEISAVVSDKPASGALAIARDHGIAAIACSPKEFATRAEHDAALTDVLHRVQPDLIVCAGYLRILSVETVKAFERRMINIHPSLLPKYPGLHTHARALEAYAQDACECVHGASVHGVIPALDAGPVFAQVEMAIEANDTPETLSKRLLPKEHELLTAVVEAIVRRELVWKDRVEFHDRAIEKPLRLVAPNQLGV